jgi:hypothetical protein
MFLLIKLVWILPRGILSLRQRVGLVNDPAQHVPDSLSIRAILSSRIINFRGRMYGIGCLSLLFAFLGLSDRPVRICSFRRIRHRRYSSPKDGFTMLNSMTQQHSCIGTIFDPLYASWTVSQTPNHIVQLSSTICQTWHLLSHKLYFLKLRTSNLSSLGTTRCKFEFRFVMAQEC